MDLPSLQNKILAPEPYVLDIYKCVNCGKKWNKSTLQCGHILCRFCASELNEENCPVCFEHLQGDHINEDILRKIRQNHTEYLNFKNIIFKIKQLEPDFDENNYKKKPYSFFSSYYSTLSINS